MRTMLLPVFGSMLTVAAVAATPLASPDRASPGEGVFEVTSVLDGGAYPLAGFAGVRPGDGSGLVLHATLETDAGRAAGAGASPAIEVRISTTSSPEHRRILTTPDFSAFVVGHDLLLVESRSLDAARDELRVVDIRRDEVLLELVASSADLSEVLARELEHAMVSLGMLLHDGGEAAISAGEFIRTAQELSGDQVASVQYAFNARTGSLSTSFTSHEQAER
ncbi:MAG: hypothetical protein ACIARR_05020 [Phycisphaerales bacterium JB059]